MSITELAGGGTDTIQSSVTFNISALAQIENLTLTGTANINGTGNNANNVITGNSGNNALNGANGIDTMIGGKGDDTYTINTLTDLLVENAGEGIDTISSSVTFDLTTVANIENLTLTGAAALNGTGDNGDNRLNGNTGANLLIGNGGDDTITGGTGADTMRGGLGNDVFVIGTTFVDVLEENAGEGIDTVNAQMTFDLTSVANIENLTLVNGGNFNGFGDAGNNRITGNTGNNILDGRDGNDTLNGGNGHGHADRRQGQRRLYRRQYRRHDHRAGGRGHGPDRVLGHFHDRGAGQCGEPDADRHRQYQRHGQHRRQRHHRQ